MVKHGIVNASHMLPTSMYRQLSGLSGQYRTDPREGNATRAAPRVKLKGLPHR